MVKTVEIRTMEGVQALAFEQTRNNSTGRYRSSYFYRGLPDAVVDSVFAALGIKE